MRFQESLKMYLLTIMSGYKVIRILVLEIVIVMRIPITASPSPSLMPVHAVTAENVAEHLRDFNLHVATTICSKMCYCQQLKLSWAGQSRRTWRTDSEHPGSQTHDGLSLHLKRCKYSENPPRPVNTCVRNLSTFILPKILCAAIASEKNTLVTPAVSPSRYRWFHSSTNCIRVLRLMYETGQLL